MDSEPLGNPYLMILALPLLLFGQSIAILLLIILVLSSGLISGSEVAYFSLERKDIDDLGSEDMASSKRIVSLMKRPKRLLATILISNNFVNIAIVIVSTVVVNGLIPTSTLQEWSTRLYDMGLSSFLSVEIIVAAINFLITVVGVTFLLVLFGEIAPKIYANLNKLGFARRMSLPLTILSSLFAPFSAMLVNFSEGLERRITSSSSSSNSTSKEDLDAAIELTVSSDDASSEEEADILKSIVTFGDSITKQIMKPRTDVVAFDISTGYHEVLETIKNCGYSRIPVYEEEFDNVCGILYVKDLLNYLNEGDDFAWQKIVRDNVFYAPESKNIDDLLREFQNKRTHMAIVVDEYGGCSGIVTLEDVMEEIIGDIRDEFDEEDEVEYVKIGKNNYVFDGKTMLNDICRVMDLDSGYFDDSRGESDSIAGLILESIGQFPDAEETMTFKELDLKVVAVSDRRIEKVNIKQQS